MSLKHHPAVVRGFSIVHRARMVEQPARFAFHELRRDPEPQRYRPRGAAVDVLLRHGTSDLDILDEVFSRGLYRIPPAVRAVLPSHPRVLDLGGHIGLFGAWAFSELKPAQLTSVEADPANAALLRRTSATTRSGTSSRSSPPPRTPSSRSPPAASPSRRSPPTRRSSPPATSSRRWPRPTS